MAVPQGAVSDPASSVPRHDRGTRRNRGPQTREQVRGREAYLRFNREGFDYDWHITVQRVVGAGRHAASWIEFSGPEGTQSGLCFFELGDDGLITRITDFWPDPYELPDSRAHLVERY